MEDTKGRAFSNKRWLCSDCEPSSSSLLKSTLHVSTFNITSLLDLPWEMDMFGKTLFGCFELTLLGRGAEWKAQNGATSEWNHRTRTGTPPRIFAQHWTV